MWEGLSAFEHVQCTLLVVDCPWSSCRYLALSLSSLFALARSPPVFYFPFYFICLVFFPLYSVLPLYVGLHVLCVFFYTLLSVTSVLAPQWRMFEHIHSQSAGIWLHMAAGACTPGLGCSECNTRCQSHGCLPKLAFC